MAAGATYTPIATYTVSGSTERNIDFVSIPSTYTDLIFVINSGVSTADMTPMRVGNGSFDTGNNYTGTYMRGNGSTAASGRYTSNSTFNIDYVSYPDTVSNGETLIAQFMNYANTTTYKTVLVRANNAAIGTNAGVHLWSSTSAIDRIRVYPSTNTSVYWAVGATFTLYGIVAA